MSFSKEHRKAHAILEGEDGWEGMIDLQRYYVHLTRFHGMVEADVDNAGITILKMEHGYAHGGSDDWKDYLPEKAKERYGL